MQAQDATFSLTIMHTNDTHSHHDPNNNGDGGAAREATVVKQIRAEVPNSILLNAGDRFTGTLYHQQYRGQDDVQIMNAIGYDAMTLGNHEFDDGDKTLADFVRRREVPGRDRECRFQQIDRSGGQNHALYRADVDGQKIGVIGLVTPDTPFKSSPGKELVFDDDLAAVTQRYVDELTAQGVNKIILVTHIGFDVDQQVAAADARRRRDRRRSQPHPARQCLHGGGRPVPDDCQQPRRRAGLHCPGGRIRSVSRSPERHL